MQHINIVIATPGYNLTSPYLNSLIATFAALSQNNLSWIYTNQYSSHVADAREMTIAGTEINSWDNNKPLMGQVTYDKIICIDSDISWQPQDLLNLYYSDKDIVSGAYLLPYGEVAAYPKMLQTGLHYEQLARMTETIEVEAIGFGFVAIKSGVFELLEKPWFGSVTINVNGIDKTLIGEDLSWCVKVRNNNYKIFLDPTVKVTHHKSVALRWQ
jgi:hypothetical protein